MSEQDEIGKRINDSWDQLLKASEDGSIVWCFQEDEDWEAWSLKKGNLRAMIYISGDSYTLIATASNGCLAVGGGSSAKIVKQVRRFRTESCPGPAGEVVADAFEKMLADLL